MLRTVCMEKEEEREARAAEETGCTGIVLQVITRLDFGGSSQQVLLLAEHVRRAGYDSVIVTGKTVNPHTDLEAYRERTGVRIITVDRLRRELHPVHDAAALFRLAVLFRTLRPRLIHTNCSKAGVLGRIAALALRRAPVVHTPHGHLFYGYYGPLATRLVVLAERFVAPLSDRIVLLTGRSLDDHVSRGIGPRDRLRAISPGIDLSRYGPDPARRRRLRRRMGVSDGTPVIGWAGRLTMIKAPEVFLEAAGILRDRVPEARFALLGDGELRWPLERRAGSLGLGDRIVFLGGDVPIGDFMASIDQFVLTSANEGLGIVLLEAMATGVPVIGTAVGGVPEVLDGGAAGLLVRPGDPVSLARCMLLLMKNEELSKRLSRKGRERAADYSEEKTVNSYLDLYRNLLDQGGRE